MRKPGDKSLDSSHTELVQLEVVNGQRDCPIGYSLGPLKLGGIRIPQAGRACPIGNSLGLSSFGDSEYHRQGWIVP